MGTSLSDVCDYLYRLSETRPSSVYPVYNAPIEAPNALDESQKWAIVALRLDGSLRRRLRRYLGAPCNAPIYVQRGEFYPRCNGGGDVDHWIDTGAQFILDFIGFSLPMKNAQPPTI